MLRFIRDSILSNHHDLVLETNTDLFPLCEQPLETRHGEFGHSTRICFRGRYSISHQEFFDPVERATKHERHHVRTREFVQIAPEVYAFEIWERDEDEEFLYYVVVSRKLVGVSVDRHSLTVITVSYKKIS